MGRSVLADRLGRDRGVKSEIGLAWTDRSNDENAFIIERSKHVSGWNPTMFEVVATVPAGTTTWQDTNDGDGLDAGTTYYYRVRA